MKDGTIIRGIHFSHDEITGRVTPGNEHFSLAQDGPRPYIKCDSNCIFCKEKEK